MKNVISFSLWGENKLYLEGAVANAHIAQFVYPGWTCRFYMDNTVPEYVVERLRGLSNVEIMLMKPDEGFRRLFWRIMVAADPDVQTYLIRDTDSRVNLREAVAVYEWLGSDKAFHVMRDNKHHTLNMQGGMWGGRCVISGLDDAIISFWQSAPKLSFKDHYFQDQMFLNKVLWPKLVEYNHMAHIRSGLPALKKTEEDCEFVIDLPDGRFIGQVYDENNLPLPEDRRNPLI